ncbi:FAD binding domain-containing protein [Aspergillus steynii IBT 23096]|uniref:FAD binding domain-containing protein n=1 Tax=Aspergillus steynii IBT 23096 TaxID=1392250 RepID=A0A2I2GSE3_9EURO|nr:FAD binding domain-containing protein [Aspergillus steynii IBT 23096]PLB55786.1 FAD binding domain-containing protein [Aspergillus steynii IBT 23096]
MRNFILPLVLLVASCDAGRNTPVVLNASNNIATSEACISLHSQYPALTLFPNETGFDSQTHVESWSAAAWLTPACVFTPLKTEHVSVAVKTFAEMRVPFAIRGRGGMPISDAANSNSSGVLISNSNFTTLRLSKDHSYISASPGNIWENVYKALEPYKLAAVGARLGVVGVSGFTLWGGVSFFAYKHGLASSNVRAFECVLGDGTIVEATAWNQHSDLFWALKGGGNNFCFVTRFDFQTLPAATIHVGSTSYNASSGDAFLDSVYNWAVNGSADTNSAVLPLVNLGNGAPSPSYSSTLFYNGNDSSPVALRNFTEPAKSMSPLSNTFRRRTMYNYTLETDAPFKMDPSPALNYRQRFHTFSFRVDREAMQYIHDVYIASVQPLLNISGFYTGLGYNIITPGLIRPGNEADGGNPQGIDEADYPAFWMESSLSWSEAADDGRIDAFVRSVGANLTTYLENRGLLTPFLYPNQADDTQAVFDQYPARNVASLKDVRDKYDSAGVFTELVPGGFKLAHATSARGRS